MKKYLFILLSFFAVSACSFLDKLPDDSKTDEMVWSDKNQVLYYLNNCYAALPEDNLHQDDPWLGCADELDIIWTAYKTYNINLGNWDPSTNFYVMWSTYYKAIRATLVFEENVDKCPSLSPDLKVRYRGESMFLRGYYYFLLIRQYGPVVLIKEHLPDSAPFSEMPRNSFDECVDYICQLMDEAEKLLPWSYASDKAALGRATIPACRAVKEMALLLAASPQWNGNERYANFVNKDGSHLASTEYDANKWQKAADAAKAVIDCAETYQEKTGLGLYVNNTDDHIYYEGIGADPNYNPFKSYTDLFNNGWNPEIIFGTIDQGAATWNNKGVRYAWMVHTTPINDKQGMCGLGVTMRLIDAFYMENGRTIDDPLSGYVEDGYATSDGPHYNPHNFASKEADRLEWLNDYINLDAWGHAEGDWNINVNREARYYASVNYNHKVILCRTNDKAKRDGFSSSTPVDQRDGWGRVEFYYGGASHANTTAGHYSYPITGFAPQKRVVNADFYESYLPGHYCSIYVRYAQVLLDYIEALNEVDPDNPDIEKYWNQIHERAGIPGIFTIYPGIKGNKAEQREYIIRERQIELNMEGDRYYTTRRRLLSETPDLGGDVDARKYGDGGRMWGYSADAGDPTTQSFMNCAAFYKRTAFETRVWDNKFYLFPIPQSQLDVSPGLVQNPGWN